MYFPWKSSRPNNSWQVLNGWSMLFVGFYQPIYRGKVWSNFRNFLGLNYNLSWHSHHQSWALEELHCNASDAKPGVASFGNWCWLVVPKGTRQYEAQGLVHEVPAPKDRNIRKTLWLWSCSSFKFVDLRDLPFVVWCFSVLVLST